VAAAPPGEQRAGGGAMNRRLFDHHFADSSEGCASGDSKLHYLCIRPASGSATTSNPRVATLARRLNMAWKTPKIVEIALGCEINAYACPDIKAA
jgi:coenzyme PQQ precursor peptide PqqA